MQSVVVSGNNLGFPVASTPFLVAYNDACVKDISSISMTENQVTRDPGPLVRLEHPRDMDILNMEPTRNILSCN